MEDPDVARGYLLNVAETIGGQLLPSLGSAERRSAVDCITVLLRVVDYLGVDDATTGIEPSGIGELAKTLHDSDLALACSRELLLQSRVAERHLDPLVLEKYLRGHELGGESLCILDARTLAGGRSKLTALIAQSGGACLPESFILRQDWGAGGVKGTTVVEEFELLRTLSDGGMCVPRPLLLEPSNAVLGMPFMLVTRERGTTQGDYFEAQCSATLAREMAVQLARLHRLPLADFERSTLRVEAETVEQRLAGIADFRRIYLWFGPPSAIVDCALKWLDEHCVQGGGAFSLIHNDLGAHNLLIDSGHLAAILDWELASIGHPAADLGYARHWLTQLMPWNQFLDEYRAAGGPNIAPITLDFYTLWSQIRLYTMLLQARVGIMNRMIRDIEVTSICADSLPRLLANIADQLQRCDECADPG